MYAHRWQHMYLKYISKSLEMFWLLVTQNANTRAFKRLGKIETDLFMCKHINYQTNFS